MDDNHKILLLNRIMSRDSLDQIKVLEDVTKIESQNFLISFEVFPNPASKTLNIKTLKTSSDQQIVIVNSLGQKMDEF